MGRVPTRLLVVVLIVALGVPGTAAGGEGALYKGKSLGAWIAAMKNKDGTFNAAAIRTLGEFGPGAAPAVPLLIVALASEKESVRCAAAFTLADVGPAARAAIPALIDAVKSEDITYSRSHAADALGAIGPPALPALLNALRDKDGSIRAGVLEALVAVGEPAVRPLTDLLKDPDARVRRAAAEALGWMGPEAKRARGPLVEALRDGTGKCSWRPPGRCFGSSPTAGRLWARSSRR